MSTQSPIANKDNVLDKSFQEFLARYKYELLASLGLIAMLGGIVLAVLIFNQDEKPEIEISNANENQEGSGSVQTVVVDIAGAIKLPGVYELTSNSRVKDVLSMAGGFTDSTDMDWVNQYLNQADYLEDGQKIYIPPIQQVMASSEGLEPVLGQQSITSVNHKISLNRASSAELQALPGIGEKYAQNIINARPFSTIQELLNVDGIGEKRYKEIKDLVSVN